MHIYIHIRHTHFYGSIGDSIDSIGQNDAFMPFEPARPETLCPQPRRLLPDAAMLGLPQRQSLQGFGARSQQCLFYLKIVACRSAAVSRFRSMPPSVAFWGPWYLAMRKRSRRNWWTCLWATKLQVPTSHHDSQTDMWDTARVRGAHPTRVWDCEWTAELSYHVGQWQWQPSTILKHQPII